MEIKPRLDQDLKQYMKSQDKLRVSVIRMLKSVIKNEEIQKIRPLTDEETAAVVQKEIKKRKESIEEFKKGNRPDLVEKETAEVKILLEYLPAQADDEEIRQVVRKILDAIPENEKAKLNLGKVMPQALKILSGRADGKRISAIVKEML